MSNVDSQAEWLDNLMQHNGVDSDEPANAEAWEVNELCRLVKSLQATATQQRQQLAQRK